jgi:hypothetical protein
MYNSHPDYLEEISYGWESEDNRLFALSRMELEPDHSAKISKLVAAGRFCVVEYVEVCCRHTDAFIADQCYLVGDYASREAAEKRAQQEMDLRGDWSRVDLLPSTYVREPVALAPLADDEIPF